MRDKATRVAIRAGEVRYDYDRQTWLVSDGSDGWYVESCAHPKRVAGCYACRNVDERVDDVSGIRPEVTRG